MRSVRVALASLVLAGGSLVFTGSQAAPAAAPAPAPEVETWIVGDKGTLFLTGTVAGADEVVVQKATARRELADGSYRYEWEKYRVLRTAGGALRMELEVPEDYGFKHAIFWRATADTVAGEVWQTYRLRS